MTDEMCIESTIVPPLPFSSSPTSPAVFEIRPVFSVGGVGMFSTVPIPAGHEIARATASHLSEPMRVDVSDSGEQPPLNEVEHQANEETARSRLIPLRWRLLHAILAAGAHDPEEMWDNLQEFSPNHAIRSLTVSPVTRLKGEDEEKEAANMQRMFDIFATQYKVEVEVVHAVFDVVAANMLPLFSLPPSPPPSDDNDSTIMVCGGLFPVLSSVNHCCVANAALSPAAATKSEEDSNGGAQTLCLVAARDIAAGEMITIQYAATNYLPHLRRLFGFRCTCAHHCASRACPMQVRDASKLLRCPCGGARYCDSKCQRADWQAGHKELHKDDDLGMEQQ